VAIAMQPAVPLWKVIVGVKTGKLKPGPQGPGFFLDVCLRSSAILTIAARAE
jgi:hypothetical protein